MERWRWGEKDRREKKEGRERGDVEEEEMVEVGGRERWERKGMKDGGEVCRGKRREGRDDWMDTE